jgi:hypothetical protein
MTEDGFAEATHAIEHALILLFPLELLCDLRDIGELSPPLHPHTDASTIFVYNGYPGGLASLAVGTRTSKRCCVERGNSCTRVRASQGVRPACSRRTVEPPISRSIRHLLASYSICCSRTSSAPIPMVDFERDATAAREPFGRLAERVRAALAGLESYG